MGEELVIRSVQELRLVVEATGAVVVAVGVLVAAIGVARVLLRERAAADFTPVRFRLAQYLALALEFQLAADILSTAVAPTWDEIGKLAAVAVIRTALNYFLLQEVKRETPGNTASDAAERHESRAA